MKKYVRMLKNRLAAGLEYRSNIIGTLILDLISVASAMVLWVAIYQEKKDVGGFTFNESVLYYLLIPLIGSFTQVFVSEELGYELRSGALSNYLLKPFRLSVDAFCRVIASKVNFLIVTFPVYFLVVFLFSLRFGSGGITLYTILLAVYAVVLGFLLHFVFDLSLTWTAFWIGDIWTLKHFKSILFLIFGGTLFPVDFISGQFRTVFELLPFKYMYYVPNAYLLGKRGIEHLFVDTIGVIIWMVIFAIIGNALWKLGIKRYEATGN